MNQKPVELWRPGWRAASVVALFSLFVACSRQQTPPSRAAAPAAPPAPVATPAAAIPAATSAATPALAAAFAAVYPKATVEIEADDHSTHKVKFRPALIQRVGGDVFALVSAGQDVAASFDAPTGYHAASGFATIAYLKAEPKIALMAKPFQIELSQGGWGAPPDISLLPGVSHTPTLELVSGYFDQGIGDTYATLVSLGPTPAAINVSDSIAIGHSSGSCDVEGKIVPVTPDKALDVQFSGASHGRDHYVLADGLWTSSGPATDPSTIC